MDIASLLTGRRKMFLRWFKSGWLPSSKQGGDDNEMVALRTRIVSLEKLVDEKTSDLKGVHEQLGQLSGDGYAKRDKPESTDAPVKVAEPKGDLLAMIKDQVLVEEPLVEKPLTVSVGKVEEGQHQDSGTTDVLSGLFEQQDEEVSPLKGLISSLPEVTARELVEQVREIRAMMLERKEASRLGKGD